MVKGLELFRDHFRAYADRYILIGGTACDLAMTEAGLEFRATRDLDIVLCAESIDTSFAKAFWEFVQTGGYQLQEASSGRKKFYRFQKPTNPDFPAMLELFSRVPDALAIADHSDLTPIPIDDEVSSLSAILVDDAYYGWIRDGKRDIAGVPIVGPEHMIPSRYDGRAVFLVTVMNPGGDFNEAFQVTTLAVDVETGKLVSGYRPFQRSER